MNGVSIDEEYFTERSWCRAMSSTADELPIRCGEACTWVRGVKGGERHTNKLELT